VTSADKYMTLNCGKQGEGGGREKLCIQQVKVRQKKKYAVRLTMVLKSKLNAKNKITKN
jgi:hypothetical protein